MSIRTGACLASGVARATLASGPIPNSSLGPAGPAPAAFLAAVVVAARVVAGAPLVGLVVEIHCPRRGSGPGSVGWECRGGPASPARPQAPSSTATRTGASATRSCSGFCASGLLHRLGRPEKGRPSRPVSGRVPACLARSALAAGAGADRRSTLPLPGSLALAWSLGGVFFLPWARRARHEPLAVRGDLVAAAGQLGQPLEGGRVQLVALLGALAGQVGLAEALVVEAVGRPGGGGARPGTGRGGAPGLWSPEPGRRSRGRPGSRPGAGRRGRGRLGAVHGGHDAPGGVPQGRRDVAGGGSGHAAHGQGAHQGHGQQADPATPGRPRRLPEADDGSPRPGRGPQLGQAAA